MAISRIKIAPTLTFEESLNIILEIYEKYGDGPLYQDVFPTILKSTQTSSLFSRKLNTLKNYELIEDVGDKKIKISSLGKQIIKPTDNENVETAIKQSISKIEFIGELLRRYPGGNLPENEPLSNILERHYNIQPKHVKGWLEYIRSSFRSLTFTKTEDNILRLPFPQNDIKDKNAEITPDANQEQFVLQLPMSTGSTAKISIPKNITIEDIEMIKKMIDAVGIRQNNK